jgi:hypothetical protein
MSAQIIVSFKSRIASTARTRKRLKEDIVVDILNEAYECVVVTAVMIVKIVKMTLQLLMKRIARWWKKAKVTLLATVTLTVATPTQETKHENLSV